MNETIKRVDETIENICDWVDEAVINGAMSKTPEMISALADLVAARATVKEESEMRIADPEVKVQSQQSNDFVPEDSNGKCLGFALKTTRTN